MSTLAIECNFVAHSYQGVRQTPERNEILDWPPSPARLHQALISAALVGVPPDINDMRDKSIAALHWLEALAAPEIVASEIEDNPEASTHFRLAIPQNNPAKSDLTRTSVLLAPTLRRRAVNKANSPLRVLYLWSLNNAASEQVNEHFNALSDLVAQVRYLGRSEDRVEAQIGLALEAGQAEVPAGFDRWRPSNRVGEVDLWTAEPGTTDHLIRNHARNVPARTRRSPASRFLKNQGYSRSTVEGLMPVYTGLFQLVPETADADEPPLSCDAESAGTWRSRLRQKAIDFALDGDRWDDPELAQELISGHPPGDPKRTARPHLAFVPVPSLSATAQADGRVRRFALLGYSETSMADDARGIYEVLVAGLDGESIEVNTVTYRLRRLTGAAEWDRVWRQYVRPSRIWLSVTPIAIARGFAVPKQSPDGMRKLTSNERHLRKLHEWTVLLRASLRHVGLPLEVVEGCEITLTPSPLILNTNRAERYRPPGESSMLTHARIEFKEPVQGPLVVGDRRYQGFGLLFPS